MLAGGGRFFSNGVDLDWALGEPRASIREMFLELGRLILALLEAPVPAVGAIRGHAIGAELAMFLAYDYRYGAAGRVLIGKPEILLGVPNPYYGDQLLRFVAGDFAGSDLVYTGQRIHAEEGRSVGLVHETGPKAEIEGMAWQKLRGLCDLAPAAFAESKRMRLGRFCADLREQMPACVARQTELRHSEDAQTRLREAAERMRGRAAG
ncbi:MAG: enoyl-CoA hydratase/isomerase family protein [Alphaproteobacteria bacterium]|nr:enoyl-CoA hydratase/isomerase family protein [Alphaproteobacteria bacterium]